jgi:4-amino-4-deoxy-L-arabinose transferase-like glycosyltransferase
MNSNPALIVITVVAIGVRLAFLAWHVHHPGFEWSNPDGYLQEALALTRHGSWRWTFDAVEYLWGPGSWVLPPGYPVFLSVFYQHGATSPMGAAVAQCVVGGLAVLPVYVLGRALQTPRAGLIAAAVWALWFPSVAGGHVFIQEQLYLPLLWTALAALAMCLDRWSAPRFFALAGAALALATLTRAMPLYFVPLLMIGIVFAGPVKSEGLRRSLATLAGFVLVVGPYIAWLSLRYGELILIDNHMAIWQATSGSPPGLAETARLLATDFVKNVGGKLHLIRNLFQVSGFNWAHHYSPARGPEDAWWLALGLRLLHDGLFVAASVLAPVGLVLARQRRVAVLLLGWTVLVAALTVAAGYSGARYRTPFEAALVCAAAVPLGGGFRRPHPLLTVMGLAASILIAVVVLPQYQRNLTAPVSYGLSAPGMPLTGQPAIAWGPSGFYTLATNRVVSIEIAIPDGCPDLMFDVSADGTMVSRVTAAGGESVRTRIRVGSRQLVFIEVKPTRRDAASTEAISYSVRVVFE